jgi:hypothetical protein
MRALSMPGIPEARALGCPCPPLNRSGWNHEYGTYPTVGVDAHCPVHGLTALIRDAA